MAPCACGEDTFERDLNSHRAGKKHRARMLARQNETVPRTETSTDENVPAHSNDGSRHSEIQRARDPSSNGVATDTSYTELNRNGIYVSWEDGQVYFGILEADEIIEHGPQLRTVTIKRARSNVLVHLKSVQLRSSLNVVGENFTVYAQCDRDPALWISSSVPLLLPVQFHATHEGRFSDILELNFWDVIRQKAFVITRRLHVIVGSKDDHELLKPKTPYVRPEISTTLSPDVTPIPACRPPTWTRMGWSSRLHDFPIPPWLTGLALTTDGTKAVKKIMPSSLDMATYGNWFQILMWVDEEKESLELQKYTLQDAMLTRKDPNYSVRIPGLLKKKPQVLVGDVIVITRKDESMSWEGRVHAIQFDEVRIRMPSDFSLYNGNVFDVSFRLNRLPLRRMHQAVISTPRPERLLFPKAEHILPRPTVADALYQDFVLSSTRIQDDPEKLRAVWAIIHQPARSVPFVLFGPPGTGKTTALVEAICGLLRKSSTTRMLACTPSNRAADTLALKLKQAGLTPDALLRLNAISRPVDELLSEELDPFCPINGNDVFAIPPLEELLAYRVVVSTFVSGGIPQGLGVKKGHFSHIFIDEAGQSVEPQAMIPILSLSDANTNVILAGDHLQLGPVITSPVAARLGYQQSFLERMMKRDIYDAQPWRDTTSVRLELRRQYRTHPDIFAFSNEEFYNGQLQHCADTSITHKFLRSEILVKPGYPVVFHGITGREYREGTSPSYFNIDEASLVKRYCMMLEEEHRDLNAENVGIITPYLAQRGKILEILPDKFKTAKVGTVDDFQGQERLVIILSTVRSNTHHINRDLRHSLGFVANPKRTNVALTRARALLIVIGDPVVLSLDPTWRKFLTLVHNRGGARGQLMPTVPSLDGDTTGNEGEGLGHNHDTERIQRIQAKIIRREGYEGVLAAPESDSESDSDQVLDFLPGQQRAARR
ncbi:P-loop containing nucleoside triphosphate hydrolase protein [Neolentinus lepideus HHB14362 ss-1]|uniref:RNA helicase n=1 Tax=Neolentinus lepideus HHB14362 ss-1 TaxID=1314782 RepID=A0A165RR71_9AGAM|nr:P-loop containing nucleoside triphosphate hydrolase protein [Neolentinus lepideus HHB14362 ss-1]